LDVVVGEVEREVLNKLFLSLFDLCSEILLGLVDDEGIHYCFPHALRGWHKGAIIWGLVPCDSPRHLVGEDCRLPLKVAISVVSSDQGGTSCYLRQ